MPDNSDYFDFEEDVHDFDEDGFEARVWNLLVLINPGDEELALKVDVFVRGVLRKA